MNQNSITAPHNESWAIEAHGLVKTFGENRAVDGVNLKVGTGTIYGVLGPNGAGKTTTIRMLATLLRPDAGSASIFGHDVVKEPQIVRQLIGVTGRCHCGDLRANHGTRLYAPHISIKLMQV
ncbi:hypothetical protein PUR_31770 [Paenibacillus sp. URB8-2]|nr:hypothetical protein PUR_31770 [Paenibacillus sp. URB8-2]